MVVGGTVANVDNNGARDTTFFDPVTESWSAGPLMVTRGATILPSTSLLDGRMLVQGGTGWKNCASCVANFPEIYDPAPNAWSQLTNVPMVFRYYPHPFVLPDGRVLVSSQDDQAISSKVLNLTTQAWATMDATVRDGHSSAMYLPGKIVKAGTATSDNPGHASFPTTYVLNTAQPSPVWQATASMANPRSYLNLTILPDGQVLATGGSTVTDKADFAAAVYTAELWSPVTRTWTTLSGMQTHGSIIRLRSCCRTPVCWWPAAAAKMAAASRIPTIRQMRRFFSAVSLQGNSPRHLFGPLVDPVRRHVFRCHSGRGPYRFRRALVPCRGNSCLQPKSALRSAGNSGCKWWFEHAGAQQFQPGAAGPLHAVSGGYQRRALGRIVSQVARAPTGYSTAHCAGGPDRHFIHRHGKLDMVGFDG